MTQDQDTTSVNSPWSDEDELADVEDDITSGCYVLDIGIPDMSISRLWIREIL